MILPLNEIKLEYEEMHADMLKKEEISAATTVMEIFLKRNNVSFSTNHSSVHTSYIRFGKYKLRISDHYSTGERDLDQSYDWNITRFKDVTHVQRRITSLLNEGKLRRFSNGKDSNRRRAG